jgi:hypothetical protein
MLASPELHDSAIRRLDVLQLGSTSTERARSHSVARPAVSSAVGRHTGVSALLAPASARTRTPMSCSRGCELESRHRQHRADTWYANLPWAIP